jgi:tetratricopeptide (TPR) repeat protein
VGSAAAGISATERPAVTGPAGGAADNAGGTADSPARGEGGDRAGGDKAGEAKALYDKAQYALDESDFARAHELAGASLKLRRTARTYLLRAQAEQRLDRVEDALGSVDAAAKLAPELGAVWELRGRILWAAGRRDDARAAFEKFLALEPGGPKADSVRRLLNEPR